MPLHRNSLQSRRKLDKSSVSARPAEKAGHARLLQRALHGRESLAPAQVLQLQRLVGNRATGALLAAPIQTKLIVRPADDPYEREADSHAHHALRGRGSKSGSAPTGVQPSRAHGLAGGPVDDGVAQRIEQRRGQGQPLDRGMACAMGRYFESDFSRVRVHTGPEADTLNRSLNARAFTTGSDIFFGKEQYNPRSSSGQELIAHELTHVVQQGGAGAQGQGDVQRGFVVRRDFLVQRDDDDGPGVVGNAIGLGDIGGAIVEVYEAYNGDESASTIVKAVTELAGGIADTQGGVEDTGEGATGEGIGAWSSLVGGVTSLAAKGTGLVSTLAEYGRSALDYVSSFGYGSEYIGKVGQACSWLGGWAKSASDLINPYAFYTDMVASGSKAVKGMTDGWKAGNALHELANLVKCASSREAKKAAELLFNLAWWQRMDGYSKSTVGAIEGGAAIFLSPLSKGLTAVMTKAYEGGWTSYLLRAIGSTFTSQVYSNAQVKQQAGQDRANLNGTIGPLVANGKIKDIVALCKAAIQLGMADFAQAIVAAFTNAASRGPTRVQQRRDAFVQQVRQMGLAKEMGL